MTSSRSRALFTACAAAALPALLVACTSGGGAGVAADPTPSRPSGAATAAGSSDAEPAERAEAALAGLGDEALVEAGVEKVTDGVHTEHHLEDGKPYRITLVCVGQGSAQLAFRPAGSGRKGVAVPCDGALVHQRVAGAEPLRIDVDGPRGQPAGSPGSSTGSDRHNKDADPPPPEATRSRKTAV
ncbi:hypothetical protein [Streptomyces sp. MA5143a]|uniref:hypothetical protein n=1 Tax=Streptomyces sp. MA5143a TaxID=2083010 RepID=UPI000D26E0AF|nr:hypothetical protein [Streptomyces sp. MA5143a]SPF05353.1 hypothetical protein SMA5143A_6164 [Streptomyces sp. MA5143a]